MIHLGIKSRVTRHLSYVRSARVHGRAVRVPILFGLGTANIGDTEPCVDAAFAAALKLCSGTFVDVGANLGQCLLKVKTLDEKRRYVGFEASLFCSYYISRLIDENRFTDCLIIPRGLSDEEKVSCFYFSDSADPQGTTIPDFWTGDATRASSQTVFLDQGDAAFERLGRPSVGILKIDVEGAELDVLKGFRETLLRERPLIIAEVLPYFEPVAGSSVGDRTSYEAKHARASELRTFLEGAHYSCFRLQPGGNLEKTWDFTMERYDPLSSNYLFLADDGPVSIAKFASEYKSSMH